MPRLTASSMRLHQPFEGCKRFDTPAPAHLLTTYLPPWLCPPPCVLAVSYPACQRQAGILTRYIMARAGSFKLRHSIPKPPRQSTSILGRFCKMRQQGQGRVQRDEQQG